MRLLLFFLKQGQSCTTTTTTTKVNNSIIRRAVECLVQVVSLLTANTRSGKVHVSMYLIVIELTSMNVKING